MNAVWHGTRPEQNGRNTRGTALRPAAYVLHAGSTPRPRHGGRTTNYRCLREQGVISLYALPSEGKGHKFESCRARQSNQVRSGHMGYGFGVHPYPETGKMVTVLLSGGGQVDHRPIARVHVSREVPKKYQRHSRKLAKAAARKFDRTPQQ